MRNSEAIQLGSLRTAAALMFLLLGSAPARGQTKTWIQAEGFAVERFSPSAAGAGWWVMDDLNFPVALGGALGVSSGYAHDPLKPLISDQAFLSFRGAVSYERFRVSLDFPAPLLVRGHDATRGAFEYRTPRVDLGSTPDTLSDARVGLEARLAGSPGAKLRLGVGAQLIMPTGAREDGLSDGTYRAMLRGLFAGDLGAWSYAGHVGVHVRPLDDAPWPGGPRGSELLFGAAGGRKVSVSPGWTLTLGPELFGETAFRDFLGASTTGLEGLMTARMEQYGVGPQLRLKLGAGAGIDSHFGAPAWRVVLGVELVGNAAVRQIP